MVHGERTADRGRGGVHASFLTPTPRRLTPHPGLVVHLVWYSRFSHTVYYTLPNIVPMSHATSGQLPRRRTARVATPELLRYSKAATVLDPSLLNNTDSS